MAAAAAVGLAAGLAEGCFCFGACIVCEGGGDTQLALRLVHGRIDKNGHLSAWAAPLKSRGGRGGRMMLVVVDGW